ncbi:MAG: DUF368 domain-containing protein [Alteromonadaceae bacterium]|nr:MAG: DUF368 domain-containing protein [Alteromonadaceae bacterium]
MTERSFKDYIIILIKGLAMGAADVVPGVSGGTIAFITGIYDEMLDSLKRCNPSALIVLFKEGPVKFWHHINGNFLLALFGGILLSIKTFASVISYQLQHSPLLVWSFFAGLICASVLLLYRQQPAWRLLDWLYCALGASFVILISLSKSTQLPGDWWVLFFGGFIAICAMILPGISGSFILLLLGLYPAFLNAIKDVDLLALASFGAGCIAGLLVFSRFVSWLLSRYHQKTLAVLIGFLIGSLNVVWPWKIVLEAITDRHGELIPLVQRNVSPWSYSTNNGEHNQLLFVIIAFFGGIGIVWITEYSAHWLKSRT